MSCSECSEYDREKQGCEKPTQAAVWADDKDQYFNCPIKFVSDEIYDFVEHVNYAERFKCAPEYEEAPNRFVQGLAALNAYERYWQEQDKPGSSKDDQSAQMMMQVVNGRKKDTSQNNR